MKVKFSFIESTVYFGSIEIPDNIPEDEIEDYISENYSEAEYLDTDDSWIENVNFDIE